MLVRLNTRHWGWVIAWTLLVPVGMLHAQNAKQPEEQVEPKKFDAAVEAVLAKTPETPRDLCDTVLSLMDLGAAEEAAPFLKQLVDAKLDDAALAALVNEFKSPAFLRLALNKELAPEGATFSSAAMQAADKFARDQTMLAKLISQLKDPSPEVRRAALVDLRAGQTSAISMLLGEMAKNPGSDNRVLQQALLDFGGLATDLLIGALDTQDDRFKAQVIEVLGQLDSNKAALYLLGPATGSANPQVRDAARGTLLRVLGREPSKASAAAALHRRIKKYYGGTRPLAPDHEGMVEIWDWDDSAKASKPRKLPADDYGMLLAAQLSKDLYELDPGNRENLRLSLAARLEAAKIRSGYNQPLPRGAGTAYEMAAAQPLGILEQTLNDVLQSGHLGAALGIVEVLGDRGSEAMLHTSSVDPAPLVQAVRHGDRRLRFAAVAALMKINPTQPYPGSHFLPEALSYFATTGGTLLAVIGHPRANKAQDLAAMLSELGYESRVAYTGKEFLRVSKSSSDVDLALIDMSIQSPGVREVLYQMRRTPQTSRVPAGIVATIDNLDEARRIAHTDPLTLAMPRPHTTEAVSQEVERLDRLVGRSLLSVEERKSQAVESLKWLARLSQSSKDLYDLSGTWKAVELALQTPELTQAATTVLAAQPTASAQRSLVNMASRQVLPIESRQAAAKAFQTHVQKQGILLTTEEILRQYDRYNASETSDKPTQQLMALILDVIENPKKSNP